IADHLIVGAQPWRRCDHDARGAVIHYLARQFPHRGERWRADTDDHRYPIPRFAQHPERERFGLGGGELVRLAHHAEDGDAVDAALDVEVDELPDTVQVERAVVPKRRHRDDEDALSFLVQPDAHHPRLRSSRCKLPVRSGYFKMRPRAVPSVAASRKTASAPSRSSRAI